MQINGVVQGLEITLPKSEPTGVGEKDTRVSIITNKSFRDELKLRARYDGMTVSDLTRHLWNEYIDGRIRIKRSE